jgi:hypothetical protein
MPRKNLLEYGKNHTDDTNSGTAQNVDKEK